MLISTHTIGKRRVMPPVLVKCDFDLVFDFWHNFLNCVVRIDSIFRFYIDFHLKLTCLSYELLIKDSLQESTRCILEGDTEDAVPAPLIRCLFLWPTPEKDPKDFAPTLSVAVVEYPIVAPPPIILCWTILVFVVFYNCSLLFLQVYILCLMCAKLKMFSINSNKFCINIYNHVKNT